MDCLAIAMLRDPNCLLSHIDLLLHVGECSNQHVTVVRPVDDDCSQCFTSAGPIGIITLTIMPAIIFKPSVRDGHSKM